MWSAILLFLKKTSGYSFSTLLFSFLRQLIALPIIQRLDEKSFIIIATAIFLIEMVSYCFVGGVPDYLTKNSTSGCLNEELLNFLQNFSLLSLSSVIIFYLLTQNVQNSIILSIYVYFCTRNNLALKVYFNKLQFNINWVYILFKSLPLIVVLITLKLTSAEPTLYLAIFCISLALCEMFFFIFIKKKLCKDFGFIKVVNKSVSCKPLLYFIFSYFSLALLIRGDIVFYEYFIIESVYVEIVKALIVINFFITPVVLVVSNPLLSYLSYKNILGNLKNGLIYLFSTLTVCFIVATIVSQLSRIVASFIFSGEDFVFSNFEAFIIAFFILFFHLLRTFNLKFSSSKGMIYASFSVVLLSFFSAYFFGLNGVYLVILISILRGAGMSALLLNTILKR
ncbi:hypothetical protein ATS72_013605 [Pseudoalteromonas sp. 13-15]|uniref:hypothetical protein n=1 Tax=Pseudoalteromonas TaxID=53246 RepID=UPI0007316852|nr:MULTISPECIES: hypothetical protein [Pseudoalteromonas]AUL74557.1 hypothetical protein ATS72_013605 [Pseudoalteromonas sp. 13-15]SIO05437.1 hypothetical protein SAMN05878071_2726 [Pseudoalteromonas marina]